jgi:hypothetical protein
MSRRGMVSIPATKDFNILLIGCPFKHHTPGGICGLACMPRTHAGTGTRVGASLVMLFLAGGVSVEHVTDHGGGKLVFPQEHLPGIILL